MYNEEVLNKRFTKLLSGKNSSKKLNICFIYYCFSISYVFNVTVTASAKYLKSLCLYRGFFISIRKFQLSILFIKLSFYGI